MSILSSTPTPGSTSPNLSVLIDLASSLSQLLTKIKPEPKSTSVQDSTSAVGSITNSDNTETSLCRQVQTAITAVLRELNAGLQDQGSDQLIEESVAHVRSKIQAILNEFIQLDSHKADYYRRLAAYCETSISFRQLSSSVASTQAFPEDDTVQDAVQLQASAVYIKGQKIFDFEDNFRKLSSHEKQCLLCFTLFPEESMVERTLLVYWWIALGLVDLSTSDGLGKAQGDQILSNLVKEGFISRIIMDKESNTYKLRNGIYSKLIHQAKQDQSWYGTVAILQKVGSFSIDGVSLSGDSSPKEDEIEVLLNVGKHNFDEVDTTKGLLSGMKNVKVAHLGICHRDSEHYIVVKDTDFLKSLRHMKELKLLSLRGMSGIVELPGFVYKHEYLKVLDLRACHNLEILPEGIESLKQLTHLDMSECYLLSGVPKGIVHLSKLRVLKGFIVNPDPEPSAASNNLEIMSTCAFSELSTLQKLRKLSIRTRRMDFPTKQDVETVAEMGRLKKLKIAWVGTVSDDLVTDDSLQCFMHNLEKLELRAAPKTTASKLLQLIADEENSLSKLYIIGGELDELSSEEYCFHGVSQLRLRYLPSLHLDWSQCRRTFPDLNHLDIRNCENLVDFPCDEDGIWRTDS